MPRQAQLEPRWLVGLLVAWGRHKRRESTGSLGYYSVNPMLKDGIRGQAQSHEPMGYGAGDFRDLEKAMQLLDKPRLAAVVRYTLPEKARAFDEEWGYSTDSWLRLLKAGLADLEAMLARIDTCAS